jgi:hypothetical protein
VVIIIVSAQAAQDDECWSAIAYRDDVDINNRGGTWLGIHGDFEIGDRRYNSLSKALSSLRMKEGHGP